MKDDASGFPHFVDAPIIEALLNLQTAPVQGGVEIVRSRFAEAVDSEYPIRQTLGEFTFAAGPDASSASAHQQTGLVFRSNDGRQALQARVDGLAFSRFAPYDRWQTFIAEARRWWDVYRETVADVDPIRVGIRTINSLPIPSNAPIESYVHVYPAIPSDVSFPQLLTNFMMRLTLPVSAGGTLNLQMAYLQPTLPDVVNVLLDLDFLFPRQHGVPLWDQVAALRPIKDSMFLAILTDKMKELLHARGQ